MFTFPITMNTAGSAAAPFANLKSVDFNGTNQYLNAGDATVINSATALTVSLWAKQDTSGGAQFLINKYTSSTDRFHFATSGGSFFVNISAGGVARYGTTATLPLGEWHHYCMVFDGGGVTNADKLKFYVDGALRTLAFTGTMPTALSNLAAKDLLFGDSTGSSFYDGHIDDPSIFDVALDQSEVNELFGLRTPNNLSTHSRYADLKHLWLMGDDPSDDTTGVGIIDQIGSNDAAPFNMIAGNIVADPAIVDFSSQLSVLFDGVDEDVNFGNNYDKNSTDSWSVSAWIKPTTISGVEFILTKKITGSGNFGWWFGRDAGNIRFGLRGSASSLAQAKSTGAITAGAWHHVAATYDGSEDTGGITFYINGSSTGTTALNNTWTTGNVSNTEDLLIASLGGTSYFDGNINNVSTWNKELSGAEITEIYNSGLPGDLDTHSAGIDLAHWWKMGDGDTFPTLTDHSGIVDGTMVNMEASDIEEDAP